MNTLPQELESVLQVIASESGPNTSAFVGALLVRILDLEAALYKLTPKKETDENDTYKKN